MLTNRHLPPRKSVFSLNELGQVNGTAGGGGGGAGGGGLANDEEMPEQHELGEELAFTGRWVTQDTSKLIEASVPKEHSAHTGNIPASKQNQ